MRDLLGRLAALQPRLSDGLFPLAQTVGSGEISLAMTAYDSAVRVRGEGRSGQDRRARSDAVRHDLRRDLKYGKNPNTARLFLSWLATPEGAITFEKMTKRGNFLVAGTEISKLLKDRQIVVLHPRAVDRAVEEIECARS